MTQKEYKILIDDDYETPLMAFETNQDYLNFVLNNAAKNYKTHYKTLDIEDGITAARKTYNDVLNII